MLTQTVFSHDVGVCIMDDDRYIIDLRDLELGFSVWQVSIIVTLNSTIQTLPKIGRYLIHSLNYNTMGGLGYMEKYQLIKSL